MPKISVVMPVYNGESYLGDAVDSILNQTFSDFEFIIINDCSTDNTERIVKSYKDNRIVYIKNEKNLGVAESLNRGINMAKGTYIARMDADDISLPERFEKQIDYLNRHCNCGICGSSVIEFCENLTINEKVFSQSDSAIKVDLIFGNALAHPTVMIRKTIFDSMDIKYDKRYEKAEDYELWVRIAKNVNMHSIKKPLLKYRIHENQVSKSANTQQNIAVRHIRQNILKDILGDKCSDEYTDAFNMYFETRKLGLKEYEDLVRCLKEIKISNGVKKIYSQRILSEQIFYIKYNLANMFGKKFEADSFYEWLLVFKNRIHRCLKGE